MSTGPIWHAAFLWLACTLLATAAPPKEDKKPKDNKPAASQPAADDPKNAKDPKEVWDVPDAPWRIKMQAATAPERKGAGWRIELPEFGVCRGDASDVILLESGRREIALDVVWHGPGRKTVLLAESMPGDGKEAALYFGGGKARAFRRWNAEGPLILETRRLPDGADVSTFRGWQEAWRKAPVDGAGFASNIFAGENPFGTSRNFLSRYIGWLKVPERGDVSFYTLSRERSWVMLDGSPLLAWTKTDPPPLDPRQVPVKEVALREGFARVEYCHVIGNRDDASMTLGWNRGDGGKLITVPPTAWVQAGTVKAGAVESRDGLAVPLATLAPHCYYGYADQWCVLWRASVENLPEGWEAVWQWPAGREARGPSSDGVALDLEPMVVSLRLQGPNGKETAGRRVSVLPKNFRAASVNNDGERKDLLDRLAAEDPARLPAAWRRSGFLFLRDLGPVGEATRWARAWLAEEPSPVAGTRHEDPLRTEAHDWVLRDLARENPFKALRALQALPPETRKSMGVTGDLLEIDLRLAEPGDAEVVGLATRLAGQGNRDIARRARVRMGDFHLMGGRFEEAARCYREATDGGSLGGRAPLIDRASALEIEEWIKQDQRAEARRKLSEWELRNPAAKLDADFLLWSGRVCGMEENWRLALREFENSLKARPDAPEVLEVRFWQARAFYESGRKDDARKIWDELARDYPKHERAEACKQWSAKP